MFVVSFALNGLDAAHQWRYQMEVWKMFTFIIECAFCLPYKGGCLSFTSSASRLMLAAGADANSALSGFHYTLIVFSFPFLYRLVSP